MSKSYTVEEIEKICAEKDTDFIIANFENFALTFSCRPNEKEFPIYSDGAVIDEDKSVKWNREEVTKRRQARLDETNRLKQLKNELISIYDKALMEALASQYDISKSETELLWDFFYREHHSYGLREVHTHFVDFMDTYKAIRRLDNVRGE